MTVLQGSLETFALPDVFRLLAHNKVTGALKIVRESGDGVVYFRDGEVYFSFSSLTREFLGQRLVNAKLITQGQLLRVLDEQKRAGDKRLGDLLTDKGYISPELLDTFLKEQIQDAVFHLLQWDAGTFEYEEGVLSPQEVGLSVSVENLIMESSRRIEEWEVIQRKIPTLDVIVRMAPVPPGDAKEINIKPEEWTLMVLADGHRTVREIAAASERSEFDACRVLYGLVTAGLLDVASSPVAPSREAPSRLSPRDMEDLVRREAPEPVASEKTPEVATPVTPAAPTTEEPQAEPELAEAEAEPEKKAPTKKKKEEKPEPEPAEEEAAAVEVATEAGEEAEPEKAEAEVVAAESGIKEVTEIPAAMAPSNGAEEEGAPMEARTESGVTKEVLLRLIAGVRNL